MNAMSSFPEGVPLAADYALTPGGFMKACRQRAGLTKPQVARRITVRALERLDAERDLGRLEANVPGDYSRLIKALRDFNAFPFDFGTFAALSAETNSPEFGEFDA